MDILSQINHRERQLLVTSYLYYKLDENIITDDKFDEYAFDLVSMMERYPKEFKKSDFYKGFCWFDGSSGFDLPYMDERIKRVALWFHKNKE